MPYTAPATVVTGTAIASTWGNSVKTAADYLANPPACRVYNNAAISHATSGTAQALTFNSERYKTVAGMHSTSTNTGRIVLTDAGLYLVFCTLEFAANATGFRQAYIRLNGTTPILVQANQAAPATIGHQLNVAGAWKFAANDYIEVIVNQNSGAALNVNVGASYTPEFGATWIGLG